MVYFNQGKGIDNKGDTKMTCQITFKNLTDEQQNKFIELYKSIPFDLVATFEEWADLMGLKLQVNEDKHITELVVIG